MGFHSRPYTLEAHKTTHEDTGADEISVAGLSGLLADDQHVLDAEVTAVAIAKALLTAAGDIIYASGASTPARLAKGANGEVLTLAAGLPSWAAAAEGAPTKEFFIPVTFAKVMGMLGDFAIGRIDDINERANITFHTPHDFSSITEAVLVVIYDADHAAMDLDIFSDYATAGEAYNTHSESDTVSTYAFTANQIKEIDISGLLSSLAADDYVGIQVLLQTDVGFQQVCILGVRLKYS